MQRAPRGLVLTLLILLASAGSGWTQFPQYQAGAGLLMTRAELESLLAGYGAAVNSRNVSSDERALAESEIALIEARLASGDFQIGDQVAVSVQGHEQLSGTFTVTSTPGGPALRLPDLGDIPVGGVLRSEIEEHLRREIARYIRAPVIHAEATIRISILEGVERPGFYSVGAEDLLTDLLMLAGGPLRQARLDKIRIERGGEPIWRGEALQQAITQGRTLDQLSLRAGDRIIVPVQGERRWLTVLQASSVVIPAVFALSRIF